MMFWWYLAGAGLVLIAVAGFLRYSKKNDAKRAAKEHESRTERILSNGDGRKR